MPNSLVRVVPVGVLSILFLCACSSRPTPVEAPPEDQAPPELPAEKTTTIMVIGDVQLRGTLLHPTKGKPVFTLGEWKSHKLYTEELEAIQPKKLFADVKPDLILQVGDLVEFSSGSFDEEEDRLSLVVGDRKWPAPYDEWEEVLEFFPEGVDAYPVPGNHEYYKKQVFIGVPNQEKTPADEDALEVKLTNQRTESWREPGEMRRLLLAKVPHLEEKVTFHEVESGEH